MYFLQSAQSVRSQIFLNDCVSQMRTIREVLAPREERPFDPSQEQIAYIRQELKRLIDQGSVQFQDPKVLRFLQVAVLALGINETMEIARVADQSDESKVAIVKHLARFYLSDVIRQISKLKFEEPDRVIREILTSKDIMFQYSNLAMSGFKKKPGQRQNVVLFEHAKKSGPVLPLIPQGVLSHSAMVKLAAEESIIFGPSVIDRLPEYFLADVKQNEAIYIFQVSMGSIEFSLQEMLYDQSGQLRPSSEDFRVVLAKDYFRIYPERLLTDLHLFRFGEDNTKGAGWRRLLFRESEMSVADRHRRSRIKNGEFTPREQYLASWAFIHRPIDTVTAFALFYLQFKAEHLDITTHDFEWVISELYKKTNLKIFERSQNISLPELSDQPELQNKLRWLLLEIVLAFPDFEFESLSLFELIEATTGFPAESLSTLSQSDPRDFYHLIWTIMEIQALISRLMNTMKAGSSDPEVQLMFSRARLFQDVRFGDLRPGDLDDLVFFATRLKEAYLASQVFDQLFIGWDDFRSTLLSPFRDQPMDAKSLPIVSEHIKKFILRSLAEQLSKELPAGAIRPSQIERWKDVEPFLIYVARLLYSIPEGAERVHSDVDPVVLMINSLAAHTNGAFANLKFIGLDHGNDHHRTLAQLEALSDVQRAKWMSPFATIQFLKGESPLSEIDFRNLFKDPGEAPEAYESFESQFYPRIRSLQRDPRPLAMELKSTFGAFRSLQFLAFMLRRASRFEGVDTLIQFLEASLKIAKVFGDEGKLFAAEWAGVLTAGRSIIASKEVDSIAIVDLSADFENLLMLGACVQETCQHFETGGYFQSVLGYVLDAHTKAVLVYHLDLRSNKHFQEKDRLEIQRALSNGKVVRPQRNSETGLIEVVFEDSTGQRKLAIAHRPIKPTARSIMRVGRTSTGEAAFYMEPVYKHEDSKIKDRLHSILRDFATSYSGFSGIQWWNQEVHGPLLIKQSRNPFGTYSDIAGFIQTEDFWIDLERLRGRLGGNRTP